jgi:hypothetical protein
MIASLVITPLVSLLTPAPADETVARAFGEGGTAVAGADGAVVVEGEPV